MSPSVVDAIPDIRWIEHRRLENGTDSFVVPFPRLTPANLVFHGDTKFEYGHYGIHLGQADILTFLGPSDQRIVAHFIDCRRGSPTARRQASIAFGPSSGRALYIPPGVAHAFDGLERVFTVNSYELFLPTPERWASGKTDWTVENDVINVPMDATGDAVQLFDANSEPASDVFYRLIADRQRATIPSLDHEYPFTEDVRTADGQSARLLLRKRIAASTPIPETEAIPGIDGVRWERHLIVRSGPNSGFVPLLDPFPFYIVDHGEVDYSHDAFGIHIGQEDRLTFLGPSSQSARLTLVDCRLGSRTLHSRVQIEFSPDPQRRLVIPNGVAHRFQGLERIFTVNRPKAFLPASGTYDPSTDVIDWPAERMNYPTLEPNGVPAGSDYYDAQVTAQKSFLQQPPKHGTPIVLLASDEQGRPVRVAIRIDASPA